MSGVSTLHPEGLKCASIRWATRVVVGTIYCAESAVAQAQRASVSLAGIEEMMY